jgi:hypothetical protein
MAGVCGLHDRVRGCLYPFRSHLHRQQRTLCVARGPAHADSGYLFRDLYVRLPILVRESSNSFHCDSHRRIPPAHRVWATLFSPTISMARLLVGAFGGCSSHQSGLELSLPELVGLKQIHIPRPRHLVPDLAFASPNTQTISHTSSPSIERFLGLAEQAQLTAV